MKSRTRLSLAVCLVGLSGCASVARQPLNYTDVQALQVSNPGMARRFEGDGVRFTAVFGAVMPGFGIQGMSQYEETHVLAAFGSNDGSVTLPYVLVPREDPILPTLRRGDEVEIEGVPEVDASGVYARVVVFALRRLRRSPDRGTDARRPDTSASAQPVRSAAPVAAAAPMRESPLRIALIVEGTMAGSDTELAIRDALNGPVFMIIPAAEVSGARTFLGPGLLTPGSAEGLRERLGADRVIVVQTSTVPGSRQTDAEVSPPPAGRRHGHHHRPAPMAPLTPPSLQFATQVYSADRDGTSVPATFTGNAGAFLGEAVRAVRALPPLARAAAPLQPAVLAATTTSQERAESPVEPGSGPEAEPGNASGSAAASRGASAPAARMWIDLGFHLHDGSSGPAGGRGYWLSPELGFSFPIARTWSIDLILPTSFGAQKTSYQVGPADFYSVTGPAGSLGNPTATFYRWFNPGSGTLDVGGVVTLPVTSLFDDNSVQLSGAAGLRGLWDLWRWATHDVALVGRTRYRGALGRLDLSGTFAMGLLIPTGSEGGETEFLAQFGFGSFVRFGERAGIGLDLRGVWLPGLDGLFQVSLVPRIRFAPGRSNFDIWFNINLNEPYGPSFDRYRVWGLGTTLDFPL